MVVPKDEVKHTLSAIDCLAVYRGVFDDHIMSCLREVLELAQADDPAVVRKFFSLFGTLFELDRSSSLPGINIFKNHLLNAILVDENTFSLAAEKNEASSGCPDQLLIETVKNDLRLLQIIFDFDLPRLAMRFDDTYSLNGLIPDPSNLESPAGSHTTGGSTEASGCQSRQGESSYPYPQHYFTKREQIKKTLAASSNWSNNSAELQTFYRQTGSGRFGRYWAFRWNGRSSGYGLTGVADPDQIRLEDMVGYEDQKKQILLNTEQFICDLPANNMLLYGDRGTGKSSTIKSLIHRFGHRGLRIIEITRHDLHFLPEITEIIAKRAQKFIIFIDDLSFEEDETEYKELKALLEGSIEKPPDNVLVYASSNRRNIVREYFSDREPDEVGKQDTYQEKLSLADRFGIKLVYSVPTQDEYLDTVDEIAKKSGITMGKDELHELALRWALWHNARSGRTARQFVDDLKGRLGLQSLENRNKENRKI